MHCLFSDEAVCKPVFDGPAEEIDQWTKSTSIFLIGKYTNHLLHYKYKLFIGGLLIAFFLLTSFMIFWSRRHSILNIPKPAIIHHHHRPAPAPPAPNAPPLPPLPPPYNEIDNRRESV